MCSYNMYWQKEELNPRELVELELARDEQVSEVEKSQII